MPEPRPRADRAQQFMPFAALKGYYDLIRERERVAEPKRELTDEAREAAGQGVGVAALRELADDLESLEVTTSSTDLASGYEQGCEYAAERIRKAVEGAKEPEVLGADGEPIREGETVWDSTSPNDPTSSTVWRHGGPLKVLRRNDVRAGFVICENDQGIPLDCLAADLTHAAPDTQERIDDDATSDPATYCNEVLGWDAEKIVLHSDYAAQNEAMIADLLRRQRELDAKTTGGE